MRGRACDVERGCEPVRAGASNAADQEVWTLGCARSYTWCEDTAVVS